MKEYGFNKKASHSAVIYEKNTEADFRHTCTETTPGLIIGTSEWAWITKDNAHRICAALKYFSETSTKDIQKAAATRMRTGLKK